MLQTIRDAYAELGDPFTVKRFQRWRTERLAAARTRRRPARVASYHAIWSHFGDWATACDRALGVDQPLLAAAADAASASRGTIRRRQRPTARLTEQHLGPGRGDVDATPCRVTEPVKATSEPDVSARKSRQLLSART